MSLADYLIKVRAVNGREYLPQADQTASTSIVTITFKRCTPPHYATEPHLQTQTATSVAAAGVPPKGPDTL